MGMYGYMSMFSLMGVVDIYVQVAGLKAYNLIKKRLQHRCFLVNVAKFLRSPFLIEQLRWLLLCYRYNPFPIHYTHIIW